MIVDKLAKELHDIKAASTVAKKLLSKNGTFDERLVKTLTVEELFALKVADKKVNDNIKQLKDSYEKSDTYFGRC